jgi:hypothetical protein
MQRTELGCLAPKGSAKLGTLKQESGRAHRASAVRFRIYGAGKGQLANLPANLSARKVTRSRIRWRNAIIGMRVYIGVAGLHRINEGT